MVRSARPNIPCPSEFGWECEGEKWIPIWITIPEAAKCTMELVKCVCTGNCTSCSCGKADLECTLLCKCNCPKPT